MKCTNAPVVARTADHARRWQDSDGEHIDVRGLPPPEPLVEVLRLVRALDDGVTVIMHHDREPVLLYPELAQIGWKAERIEGEVDEVRLRLRRDPA